MVRLCKSGRRAAKPTEAVQVAVVPFIAVERRPEAEPLFEEGRQPEGERWSDGEQS
jgi:hypothetical protein